MSGASTLRNSVKRITHKERAQPKARSKLGLLEKHKDYVVRAKDFHKKADYLKNLRKKAAEKNPDEFYFKMHKSKVVKGKHMDIREDTALDTDVVKLMKTQDMGYIMHRKAVDDRKAEKLKATLHLIGDKKSKSHKIFVDSDKAVRKFDAATHFETAPELVDRAYNRIKIKDLKEAVAGSDKNNGAGGKVPLPTRKALKKAVAKKEKSYKELEDRRRRSEKLATAASELQLQRNLMGKGTKRKMTVETDPNGSGASKTVYKWKRQRSR
jgi:U3 small nucleolar RNA-associated protein 11